MAFTSIARAVTFTLGLSVAFIDSAHCCGLPLMPAVGSPRLEMSEGPSPEVLARQEQS